MQHGTAVIKIREMLVPNNQGMDANGKPTKAKFKCVSNKTWNYSYSGQGMNLAPHFAPDKRLKIDYVELDPAPGQKYGAKMINSAVPAAESEPLTWPEKSEWGGSGGGSKGGGNGDFRTSQEIVRTSALEIAAAFLKDVPGITNQDIFDQADIFAAYIRPKVEDKLDEMVDAAVEALGATPVGDEGIPF